MKKIFLLLSIIGLLSINIKPSGKLEKEQFSKKFIEFTEKIIESVTDLIQPIPYDTPDKKIITSAQNFLDAVKHMKPSTEECKWAYKLLTEYPQKLLNPKFTELISKALEKKFNKKSPNLTCSDLDELEKRLTTNQEAEKLVTKYLKILIPLINEEVTLLNTLLEIL